MRDLAVCRWLALAALLAPLGACARSHAPVAYGFVVRVEGDPGRPLAGAAISYLGQQVGRTNETGAFTLAIRGTEGERIALEITCPDGYLSPAQPTEVVLHRFAEPERRPEYGILCRPVSRSVAVVVRADHGPRLPVLYLGKEVARTDESGAAHALVVAPANEDVEVTIATTESGSERLRPQNPSMKFAATAPDDVKVFSVAFAREPEKRAAAPARSNLPIRLH